MMQDARSDRLPYKTGASFRLWVLSCCLCFLLLPLQAQQFFSFTTARKKVKLDFTLQRNLIVIPVYLNGRGPYNFLLDTGVGNGLITNPSLIDSLQLSKKNEVQITGAGSSTQVLKAYRVSDIQVQLPGVKAENLTMVFLSEDIFNLSSYVGLPISGILGYQFFNSFVVRIDYMHRNLTLYEPKAFKYRRRDGVMVPFELEDQKPYLYALASLQDQQPVSLRLVLDTGAGHALSLEQHSHARIRVPDRALRSHLGTGLNGSIMGYVGRIQAFQLNKYRFEQVLTSFPDHADVGAKVQVDRNGNLGNDLLKRFDLLVDYPRSRLTLRPNKNFKEPFEHDMCGVELVASGENFNQYVIASVEPGSPAEEADLMPGDEILFLDSYSTRTMTLSQIDQLFRSRDGYRLMVVVRRNDKILFRLVTLRRKI